MISDIRETLFKYADDAELKVIELHQNKITISISLPSRGGETWFVRSNDVVHIDISPVLTLGHIEFGGLSLLPESYIDKRNIGYGGEEEKYRVLKIIDNDNNEGYLVLYGIEEVTIEQIC